MRDLEQRSQSDQRLALDMMWGISSGTVNTMRGNVGKGIMMCKELGIEPSYPPLGPFPVGDNVGFTVALQMLKASLLPGIYHDSHQKFDTIRNLRTAFSNIYESSWKKSVHKRIMQGNKGIALHMSTCDTQSIFFEKLS